MMEAGGFPPLLYPVLDGSISGTQQWPSPRLLRLRVKHCNNALDGPDHEGGFDGVLGVQLRSSLEYKSSLRRVRSDAGHDWN